MEKFPFDINEVASAVDKLPNLYNRVGDVVGFQDIRQSETSVTLIRRDEEIVLLDPVAREADRQELSGEDEESVTFSVPSRKIGARLTPGDIQNITSFAAGPRQLMQMGEAYARRLARLRRPHDMTFEHLRIGAVKGIVTSPRGKVLVNLFDAFGIAKKVVNFDTANENFDILGATKELADHIGDNLHGETSTGIHVFVDRDSLHALRTHPSFEKYLLGHAAALEQLAASRYDTASPNARRSVLIDGVMFESYSGQSKNSLGQTVKFIADGKGHAFPVGTSDMFLDVDVPHNRIGEVNTPPSTEIGIYPDELPQGKGFDLDTESNKMCFCQRPEALVELSFT